MQVEEDVIYSLTIFYNSAIIIIMIYALFLNPEVRRNSHSRNSKHGSSLVAFNLHRKHLSRPTPPSQQPVDLPG